MSRLVLAVLPLLLLSGCFVEEDADVDDVIAQGIAEAAQGSGNKTAAAAGVAPVLANVTFNATGLDVVFTITADDADNDTVTWTADFGDNASANGTMLRAAEVDEGIRPTGNSSLVATITHAYEGAGPYNATFTLFDGKTSVNRTIVVELAGAAAPAQDPIHFEDSVVCLPTSVLNGEVAGGSHTFDVLAGQATMVLTLAYADGPVEDLDVVATDPSGNEYESAEAGPEPPMTIATPASGTWQLAVIGYSCAGSADYTVDLVFG